MHAYRGQRRTLDLLQLQAVWVTWEGPRNWTLVLCWTVGSSQLCILLPTRWVSSFSLSKTTFCYATGWTRAFCVPSKCTTRIAGSIPQFFDVCVVCLCYCSCVCMCACMCIHVEARNWSWLSATGLQLIFLNKGISLNLECTNLARIAYHRSFCHCLPDTRITCMCHHAWHFYVGDRDPSLDTHFFRTIPLLIQPSPHQNMFKMLKVAGKAFWGWKHLPSYLWRLLPKLYLSHDNTLLLPNWRKETAAASGSFMPCGPIPGKFQGLPFTCIAT